VPVVVGVTRLAMFGCLGRKGNDVGDVDRGRRRAVM
jgi:hypothetical protein